MRRLILRLAAGLVVLWLAYLVVGSLWIHRVSQREETWHQLAFDRAAPQSDEQWNETRATHPVLEWTHDNERRQRFTIHVYPSGRFVSAVYRKATPRKGRPDRFFEGPVDADGWRRLQAALASADLHRLAGNRETFDARLKVKHADGKSRVYLYETERYASLPESLRDVDDALFDLTRAATVRPPRPYTEPRVHVRYGEEDVAGLMRGLESDRVDVYESVVDRLVALGEPGVIALERVLDSGPEHRFLPTPRYVAVLDGLATSPHGPIASLPAIRALADEPASLPGERTLKKRAQEFVDEHELGEHYARAWPLGPAEATLLLRDDLPQETHERFRAALLHIHAGSKERRAEATLQMLAMGPEILPLVLEALRHDRYERNRYNTELIDVLAGLGGASAILHAVRLEILEPSACIEALQKLGAAGVPGLLALLDSRDRFAHDEIAALLGSAEYAGFGAAVTATLASKLQQYPEEPSTAVRGAHRSASILLVRVLRARRAADSPTIDVLFAAAADPRQDDAVRLAALGALADLGPAARSGAHRLEARLGYESGDVYDAVVSTLAKISSG